MAARRRRSSNSGATSRCSRRSRSGSTPGRDTRCWWSCRGWTRPARTATIKHVMTGLNPQGVIVAPFKVPTPGGGRPRLPLARAPADTRQGHDRDLQPLALRAGARRARARPGARGDVAPALRPDQRLRAHARPRTARRSSSSSSTSRRRSSGSGSRTASTRPRSSGSSAKADVEERKLWDDYQRAYEDALSRCSTDQAPWYVIPADRNWFRDYAVAEILADTLDDLDLRYPDPEPGIEGLVIG